jgi:hypothetical protein
MALPAFDRMHNRLFARLGEQAFLRTTETCLVNIEHGVVVNYETGDDKFVQSEFAVTVDIANIQNIHSPAVGDSLTVGDAQYVIDAVVSDNGYLSRCILRGA